MTSEHADLLNDLDNMQHSAAYAVRRQTLAKAESVIVAQEKTILGQSARIVEVLIAYRLDCISDMNTSDDATSDSAHASYYAALEIAERLGVKDELLSVEKNYVDSMLPYEEYPE